MFLQADLAVAECIVGCGLAFNLARMSLFKKMLAKVAEFGTGYAPPAPNTIANKLLPELKRKVDDDLDKIRASYDTYKCTITSDGWSDTRNRCDVFSTGGALCITGLHMALLILVPAELCA